MSRPTFLDFQFDEVNRDEIARHGLTDDQLLQVLDGKVAWTRNKRSGRGDYRVIGRDHGGLAITIIVERTPDPMIWRPVTAWSAEPHEEARL